MLYNTLILQPPKQVHQHQHVRTNVPTYSRFIDTCKKYPVNLFSSEGIIITVLRGRGAASTRQRERRKRRDDMKVPLGTALADTIGTTDGQRWGGKGIRSMVTTHDWADNTDNIANSYLSVVWLC